MGDKNKGLYQKYHVERTDGKPITEGCIVLEWDDQNALEGIKAFSKAVRKNGYIKLADELDEKLSKLMPPKPGYMRVSFDSLRRKLASNFNDFVIHSIDDLTESQKEKLNSYRSMLFNLLLLSDDSDPDDCHDLSETVKLQVIIPENEE